MKRTVALVSLMGMVAVCAQAVAQSNDDFMPPGEYRFKMVPFTELSERSVSRQGDAALNLKAVRWEHSESDHFIFHTETGWHHAGFFRA